MRFHIFFIVVLGVACVHALNEDGRYRPLSLKTNTKLPNYTLDCRKSAERRNDGRYYPSNEDKYQGSDNGIYRANDAGKYKPTMADMCIKLLIMLKMIKGKMSRIEQVINYETENGIKAVEEGHVIELSTGVGLRSTGFFEYTGDDGAQYRVEYVADDGGFVPRGSHIPETPKHVQKLLEYLALQEK